nr:hypothetical protein [Actinomycetota bacterium]
DALPFGAGDVPPLGLAGSESPLEVAQALMGAMPPAIGLAAVVLAAVAVAIPHMRGLWPAVGLGAGMLAALLLLAPGAPALPLVAAAWLTCGWLVYAGNASRREQ